MRTLLLSIVAGAALLWCGIASAWDAAGHAAITQLALHRLAKAPHAPAWLNDEVQRQMVAWQAGEPDRWRGTKTPALSHCNSPDHYLDLEDLKPFGLTLQTLPKLRNEYIAAMVLARQQHPDTIKPYNAKLDPFRTQEFPGFLPYAIVEHYEKLRASFHTLQILDSLPAATTDAAKARRQGQLDQERGNVRTEMGYLAHFVGDAAQPLHTTQHHHGWIGENPKGYSTDKGIHSLIDGGVIAQHHLNFDSLKPAAQPPSAITDPENIWPAVIAYIDRSFTKVEPLYQLEKSGDLKKDAGKAFISERLTDAGTLLGDLYLAAWEISIPMPKDIDDYIRFEPKE